jgi:Skp family chaperone for outer membrane proteins
MKPVSLFLAAIVWVAPAVHARSKVATLQVQKALFSTADGKSAAAELESKFGPTLARIERERSELEGLRNRLRDEAATLTADETALLKSRMEALAKSYYRDREEAPKFEAERERVLKDLMEKLMLVVDKYARRKHYEVVLDESDARVLWRAGRTDITDEVIKIYEMEKAVKKH